MGCWRSSGGDLQLLRGGRTPQAQTIFATLHFHFGDAAFLENLQQLFDFLIGHLYVDKFFGGRCQHFAAGLSD